MSDRSGITLDGLLEQARDGSKRSRQQLFENVCDLFLSPDGRLSERERALMADILRKLLRDIEMSIRRRLGKRLAYLPDVPQNLVVDLANDEIEVARPILLASTVLRDADLIEIVRNRSHEHQLAVALRGEVSELVGDALVDQGNPDVIVALLGNADARLSRRAMEYLVAESRRQDKFREPLVHRHDLPPALACQLYWWVSAALRRHILTRYAIDQLLLDDSLEDTTAQILEDEPGAGQSILARAGTLVSRLDDVRQLTPDFLISALKQGRIPVFVAALARLTDVQVELSQRLLFHQGFESQVVLCRAAAIARHDFATIFLLTRKLRPPAGACSPGELEAALRLFDQLAEDNARQVIRHWRRRSPFQAAIARLGEGPPA